ncbi:MAG: phosphoribosylglycinamide formyltransferase, partial [Planctomycetota bacterium]
MSAHPLAVLVSGTGRTLANLFEEIDGGRLNAEIALVGADREGIRGLELARERGVPTVVVRPRDCDGPDDFSRTVFEAIDAHGCGTLVLAGFLRFLPIPDAWLGRVINIHPSLLPAHGGKGCYGNRVHTAVLADGDLTTGCTVHYVDNVYDHGPVILQAEVPVHPDDDVEALAARVFAEECRALPEGLRRHLSGQVSFEALRQA